MQIDPQLNINKKTFLAAIKDVNKAAKAVDLVYVNDKQPGINRRKKGESFYYLYGNKKVSDKTILERIAKLVIPPAWENVWICSLENGHLQVTGIDKLGRKQYRYHPAWNNIRNHSKFFRLTEFGEKLPQIREQLNKNLSLSGFPKEKILAAVVSLLEHTHIRIGNAFYEKLYGSFGLTTMKNKHVSVDGSTLTFTFKGKKGVAHKIGFSSRKLAKIVKACKEIPGKELFEYIDTEGNIHHIDSGMVNEYIRTISGGEFSAKDFRTWAGSVRALAAFKEIGNYENTKDMNHKIPEVLDIVAKHLGNTRTVCRKYYVHPVIIQLYEDKKLDKYFQLTETKDGLSEEETSLLKILAQ